MDQKTFTDNLIAKYQYLVDEGVLSKGFLERFAMDMWLIEEVIINYKKNNPSK